MFTFRSIGLGLVGVVLICALAPFNNFVLGNTHLVGNLLPIGLLLFMSMVVLLGNGAVRRFGHAKHALGPGELCVVVSMTLVACTLPSGGLMRWLPGHLVGLFNEAQSNPNYARVMDGAPLADWVFPDFASDRSADRGRERLVGDYIDRSVDGSTPWQAWVKPAIAWGTLVMLLYGAMAMLMVIVRKQWQDNERIMFPLADVYATLLAEPERGRAWPVVFCRRSFWIASSAVFLIHLLNGLAQYDSRVPSIPVGYSLGRLFTEPPLVYATYGLKSATMFFIVVGMTYFTQSRVAFSIVAFFLLFNVAQMSLGSAGLSITEPMQRDQMLGVMVMMAITLVYVGRRHWMIVIRAMMRRSRDADPQGDEFGSYAFAGWLALLCGIGAALWLKMAGASLGMSVFTVIALLGFWLVMARLAAESGLIYAQLHHAPLARSLTILTTDLGIRPTPSSFLATSMIGSLLVTDQRESAAVYTSSALVASQRTRPGARMGGMILCILLALVVGYLVSGASMLWCEYRFASTLDVQQSSPINVMGVQNHPRWYVLNPLVDFMSPSGGPRESHVRWLHVIGGALSALAVSTLYLRFAGFPLHPIGLLMVYSFPVQNSWLGILVGWMLKALIIRLGGSQLYSGAKPIFLGLIFGEAAAAAGWLIVSVVRASMGLEYRAVNLLL